MAFVATIALIVGTGIIGFWTFALATRNVPEVASGDRAIWFHLTAEYLLGLSLIAGGLLLFLVGDDVWVRVIAASALGGMVYSTINSPGYYAREGTWPVVGAFVALALVGMSCVVILVIG